ncbi:MAG: flagellar biosynthesis protein FlgJ [Clostridiaceae bacterium]|nr:flagellar biosynthesis protein FlgJ [Clostridiaceae bacterium]
MKIDGFGQVNPVDTLKTSKMGSEATEFENILKKAYDDGDKKKLKEACDQFESIMLQMMYKQMKATVPEGGFIEKSSARSIFEDMLDETMMEQASKRGMGLSDMLYKQLSAKLDRIYKTQTDEDGSDTPVTETDGAEPSEE